MVVVIMHCFIGCKGKAFTWYLNGSPDGSKLGSTVKCRGEAHRYTVHLTYNKEMDKVGIPTPFSDKVGGGKMQTSSPPVITPNRSQSNPDDMITLPRPIQSMGMDSHDVSGTSTG